MPEPIGYPLFETVLVVNMEELGFDITEPTSNDSNGPRPASAFIGFSG